MEEKQCKNCRDCKYLQKIEYEGQEDGMCHFYGDFISLTAKGCKYWQQNKYANVVD